jgi:ATP-dependent Clp protease ATP-binding subunit ClpB
MMTRIDMSEYQEKFSVTRLIGSPPGYVGYDEGGQLTEAVRRKPYSVILFDEIEKAHPDVFNILLQVLDDGRLTDNKGRLVNFTNTIIIMTSNIGSDLIQEAFKDLNDNNRIEKYETARNLVFSLLKKTIRPEFLNRIDDTIMFLPLGRNEIKNIVKLQFELIAKRLDHQGVKIEISDKAIDWIASVGFDPQYGARPVKRVLQQYVLNDLSKRILAGDINKVKPIVVDMVNDELLFKN